MRAKVHGHTPKLCHLDHPHYDQMMMMIMLEECSDCDDRLGAKNVEVNLSG